MKKAAKITVSILLALLIATSIIWYLFQYDTDFTRDLLLRQARKYESKGRNQVAVWLYELAYYQADQDDSVAIELAEYYKSIGNYTKAEYTLTKAIEDGGSAQLYIALSNTFVEQDKLRDAVRMLDQVTVPQIKAELDALRPQAPQASYISGFYSQYITVNLTSPGAAIYASFDRDYPSIPADAYTDGFTLARGETTVFAVAVAENGLVSPLAEYHYNVNNVVEKVTFHDVAFEEALRLQLGLSAEEDIYSDTLWDLTTFHIPASAITCQDLYWMPALQELTVTGSAFSDLSILSSLQQLHTLTVTDCVLSTQDLGIIARLPQLKKLTLSGCYLSSIGNLAQATGATYLDLSRNSIRDVSALSGLTNLEYLDLSENAMISLEDLSGLTKLTHLDVSYNSLVNTAPVASLTALTYLDISANSLMQVDVQGIEQLTNLTHFVASGNQLINLNFLTNLTGLKTLIVANNTIFDISMLSGLTQLEYLDFSYNEVTTLPTFSGSCGLVIINGGYNKLTTLDPLAVLQNLEYVYMDYNKNLKKIGGRQVNYAQVNPQRS